MRRNKSMLQIGPILLQLESNIICTQPAVVAGVAAAAAAEEAVAANPRAPVEVAVAPIAYWVAAVYLA